MKFSRTLPSQSLARYELKFLIPDSMIKPIADYISSYCSLDHYSAAEKDGFYQVNSLYFDTPQFFFLRNRLSGSEKRINMRIRSYGRNPSPPYFLEVKNKIVSVMRKYRASIHEDLFVNKPEYFEYHPSDISNREEIHNIQIFNYLKDIYNAQPKVLTQYHRLAYFSEFEEYSRVTFDRELKYMVEDLYNVTPDPSLMMPCDFPELIDDGSNVILEMKCYTSHVPFWMIDCIRNFNLHRTSFSKYAVSIFHVMDQFHPSLLDHFPAGA